MLTEEAKIDKIKSLLPKTDRRGRFFLPDDVFYSSVLDNEGLKAITKQLTHWIGFKPSGLLVEFNNDIDANSIFVVNQGKPGVLINIRFKSNPFACAGLIAEGLMRYYLEYRKRIQLESTKDQQDLVSLGVIYSGLGIVAINQTTSFWQQKFPKLYDKLLKSRSKIHINNYPEFTKKFAKDYGLEIGSFARYMCPWSLCALKLQSSYEPVGYATLAKSKIRKLHLTLTIVIATLLCGAAYGTYELSNNPIRLTDVQVQEKEAINILKNSYDACLKSVAQKEKIYDSKTDFFIERNINADRLRCTSIQNLHNYRVERFKSQLY